MTHYIYSEPLPHFGGTDAISIYLGQLFISASAPGTTGRRPAADIPGRLLGHPRPRRPMWPRSSAVLRRSDGHGGQRRTAARARRRLCLTDPDSNEVVPPGAAFGGDFMLTSQGDQEQIYVHDAGTAPEPGGAVALPVGRRHGLADQLAGTLYSTDSTNDAIDTVRGPFVPRPTAGGRDTVRCEQRPADLPGAAELPGELPRHPESLTGQVTPVTVVGAAVRPRGRAPVHPRGWPSAVLTKTCVPPREGRDLRTQRRALPPKADLADR